MSSKLLFLFCYGGLLFLYFRKVPFENTMIPFLSKNRYLPRYKKGTYIPKMVPFTHQNGTFFSLKEVPLTLQNGVS